MAKPLVSDELWEIVQPLLPSPKPRRFRYPGRQRLDDRKALTGILFVLKIGIPWEMLPQEMGCGSGMTCWRRLKEWQEAGVWQKLHETLLSRLHGAEGLSFLMDSDSAPFLEEATIDYVEEFGGQVGFVINNPMYSSAGGGCGSGCGCASGGGGCGCGSGGCGSH